jgi:ABC-type transporter Mla maintaining outer membrane lipid asymmetry ATPase subunit MlaF
VTPFLHSAPQSMEPVLVARGLSIAIPGGPSFAEIELAVGRGEFVGLAVIGAADLGPLLAILAGFEAPPAGEVIWNGISSLAMARAGAAQRYRLEREQRLSTGLLTASAALINNLDLFDNIALPLRYHFSLTAEEASSRVKGLMEALKLGALAGRRPAGLPRGVRRRAQLARALVIEPSILLCDDSFLEVDPESAAAIGSTLRRWREQRHTALLAIAHEPAQILPLVSKLLVLYDGKLIGSLEGKELEEEGQAKDVNRLLEMFARKEPGGCAPP